MDIKQQREELKNQLLERSIYYRGSILTDCIIIEKDIEMYILEHFVSQVDKFVDMHEIVLSRLTFDNKIAIYEELLKRKHVESFKLKFEKLFKDLRYIREVRNRMAHWPLHVGYKEDKKIPVEFSLINYRDSTESKQFTKNDFEIFRKKAVGIINQISLISP